MTYENSWQNVLELLASGKWEWVVRKRFKLQPHWCLPVVDTLLMWHNLPVNCFVNAVEGFWIFFNSICLKFVLFYFALLDKETMEKYQCFSMQYSKTHWKFCWYNIKAKYFTHNILPNKKVKRQQFKKIWKFDIWSLLISVYLLQFFIKHLWLFNKIVQT